MLRSTERMRRADISAADGDVGRCKDFLFDDRDWVVRYLVADTRRWLPGRKVLISPVALERYDKKADIMVVNLTVDAIRQSPPLETDLPVSLRYEKRISDHYRWPYYWMAGEAWSAVPFTEAGIPDDGEGGDPEGDPPESSHLRSADEVSGYRIQAVDGGIGHVEDFLVEDDSWVVRYLVVDTRNWLPGPKVLVSPSWADAVDYRRREMHLRMNRDAVRHSPPYDPDVVLERGYEERLFRHYGESPYWDVQD